ncbi:MAG: pyridoxal phosphate-dependent aminotransferase [Pyrinomonadaceae bacterium]
MSNQNPFSNRINKMHGSSTLKAAQSAARLREEGHTVIDLTVGEPDFDTPEFIKEYAREGLQMGLTKYTAASGMKSFKESIAEYYAAEFAGDVSPAEVAAACGGKQALFNAITTLINEGDEVLIPKPYWVTFPEIVNFCGGRNVYIETEETDFILTADQVKESITDRTKLLIINSPNNPTGRVVPAAEMRRIVDVCVENGIYVILDECYLLFVYPPSEVFAGASLPKEYRKYVCIAGSFSKTYAMTGWRMGYTITNEDWTKQMTKLQSHSATHPTSFVQYACARALENRNESVKAVEAMLSEYKKRRDWFIPALQTVEGFGVEMPEGAFYAFADVRKLLGGRFTTSADFADQLLNEMHIATTDGAGFGADGYLRLSYATSMENLESAVARIRDFI